MMNRRELLQVARGWPMAASQLQASRKAGRAR